MRKRVMFDVTVRQSASNDEIKLAITTALIASENTLVPGTLTITNAAQVKARGWLPIATAPKDGSAVLLLSVAYDDEHDGKPIHHPAKVAIGKWNPDGDSWVDECGRLTGEAYTLARTGVWDSGRGWFQPDEVTHWQPLPAGPEAAPEAAEDGKV